MEEPVKCKCTNWTMVGHPKSAYHPSWANGSAEVLGHHPDCKDYEPPAPTFNDDKNTFTLSTGTAVYAYGGVLSLKPDGELVSGRDDRVAGCDPDKDWEPQLTAGEKLELGRMMVRRWKRWMDGISG